MPAKSVPRHNLLWFTVCVFATMACSASGQQTPLPRPTTLQTPIRLKDLDQQAFTAFVDGRERAADLPKDGPRHVCWTQESVIQWDGVQFGISRSQAVRYLRIGFNKPITVCALLVRSNATVSVLKSNAPYPGRIAQDTEWIPALRLQRDRITAEEQKKDEFSLWVLPPGTTTRAVRFTHTPKPTDANYAGSLGGVYVMADRYANIAPQAVAFASANGDSAPRVNDSSDNGLWQAWDNMSKDQAQKGERPYPISPEHPEYITLVWPRAVTLKGLCAIWAGFEAVDVTSKGGSPDSDIRLAKESDWRPIKSYTHLQNWYPLQLGPNFLEFDKAVVTRAVRLKITRVTEEQHPHLVGNTGNGRRIWLGELLALEPLEAQQLSAAILPKSSPPALHPPIPVRFTLSAASRVTLVIENSKGVRVCNLLSDTPFPAGPNVAWWDGKDDLARDTEAPRHGIYSIPGAFVPPGEYRVRAIAHRPIDLRYEFSVYNGGDPAWETEDRTGGWLTNHTPPSSALFVPGTSTPDGRPRVYLGSYVAEGGHGLAWVDLDGKKIGGEGWVGGVWTGAPYLAYDASPQRDPDTICYAASAWEGELRLTAITKTGDKPVLKYPLPGGKAASEIKGLAAFNGVLVCSLPKQKELLFVRARDGQILGTVPLEDPRGVTINPGGQLLALTRNQLVEYLNMDIAHPDPTYSPEPLITTRLEDPQHVLWNANANNRYIIVSDRGNSHQVKLFDMSDNLHSYRAIGKAGAPKAGPYDPEHMNNPNGITIDNENHLWVAETDFQPKRVSVWTLDGKLLKAFYGPAEYGGGGGLDPQDRSKYYYHGMEFHLDWQAGKDRIVNIFYRPGEQDLKLPDGFGTNGNPETPLYRNGQRYFTNCFNSNPTNGASIAVLWRMEKGLAIPCAALGRANDWSLLKEENFKPRWPRGVDLVGQGARSQALFAWCDRNGDGHAQPDEVQFINAVSGGVTVMPDLSFVVSRVDDKAMRYAPVRFTSQQVPLYDLASGEVLASGVQGPVSSGGDQALAGPDGWTVLTNAPKPFAPESLGGLKKGVPMWSYPSLWHGLHASHEAPTPEFPGELIGTTRLLGGFVSPRGSAVGPLWCINGNMGNMYLFTLDGLFVTQLFQDVRQGRSWSMPVAQRGMLLNDLTLHDENFWPSITQTSDGQVYLVDGARTSIVRVNNLDTLRRLPDTLLRITPDDLKRAGTYALETEALRQKQEPVKTLTIPLRKDAPIVDGALEDWQGAEWITVDKRGVAANFDSNSKPYNVTAALAVAGDRLYAAYRTADKDLLRNSGETPNALFKNGGALDLMIGGNPDAPQNRAQPVAGDVRLLVTLVKGRIRALLYRAVVPGTKEPVAFSSPWRTISLDRVDDVSDAVQLAGANGNYELSIPLATLGLHPREGMKLRGDVGLLRGNGFQTLQRVYWSNKATGITADVPSEAMLTPNLWGTWLFRSAMDAK